MKQLKHNPWQIPPNSKLIPFALRYAITEKGDLYSLISFRYLKKALSNKDPKKAYYQVHLVDNDGNSRWHKIHRLVALVYVPNGKNLPEVNHKDRDKLHNHYTNLEWTTHRDNLIHARTTGTPWDTKRGEDHPMFGKTHSDGTKQLMSQAKVGVNHPKFKGYYVHDGIEYDSLQMLATHLNTHPMTVYRNVKKGLIGFRPITTG